MTFAPRVAEQIVIAGATWRLPPHPSAPQSAWSRSGSTSVVYRLDGEGPSRALKVLAPNWRGPDNAERAVKLKHLASQPGLQTAARTIITSAMVTGSADLVDAILMPWIEGYNWSDVVRARTALTPEQSLHLARQLGTVLDGLEQRNVAHCNLSGNSVMIATGTTPTIELVDLEHFFAIGLPLPQPPSAGTPGRVRARGDKPIWESQGDRFSGAVVLAEMLGWCDEGVRSAAAGEAFFAGEDMLVGQAPERYRLLLERLRTIWGDRVARLFEHAWLNDVPTAGPSFRDWLNALPERPGGPPSGPSTMIPGAAASAPQTSHSAPPAPQRPGPPTAAASSLGSPHPPPRRQGSRTPMVVVAVLLLAVIAGGAWFLLTHRGSGSPVPGLDSVAMPSPSFSGSAGPSGAPASPSAKPAAAPSSSASPPPASPSAAPSAKPTPAPASPSAAPSAHPTPGPASPSAAPSASATPPPASPSAMPTARASGSPAATGTAPPPPASGAPSPLGGGLIKDAVMCRKVDADGRAVEPVKAYDPFSPFYCAFRVPDGRKGTVVTARWSDPQGFSRTSTATISRDGESYLYVKLEPTPAFVMGKYAVALEMNGKVEQEVRFTVSATGK